MIEAPRDTRIFVSYRRADASKAATKIYAALAKHFGSKDQVFQDVASIIPGVPWPKAIDHAVGSCHVFLVVIGPQWLTVTDEDGNTRLEDEHDRHRREIEVALEREIPVLPVLIDDAVMPGPEHLPGEKLKALHEIQGQRLDMNAFAADIEDLIAVIEKAATLAVPAPVSAEPTSTEDEAKQDSALELAASGEFKRALEIAASIEDSTLCAAVVLQVATAQAEAGVVRRETQETLALARSAATGIIDDAERDRVLAAVENVQSETVDPVDGRRGHFGAAEEITRSSGTVRGDNRGTTKEPGEPDHAGNAGGSSVWYRWTAPGDGTATIDTFGSDFDTLLAVYRGPSLSELELVAANDDADGRQSRVTLRVGEGDEYMIAVDGYGGATGEIVLTWQIQLPPSNVTFDRAEELVGSRGTVYGDSTGASKEAGEPDHGGSAGGSSVWYRWTAPEDGIAIIDTFGSGFDTLLAVYSGSGLGELDLVVSNDDAGGGSQSRVTFRVADGEEYRLAVDGFGGAGGPIVLNWTIQERYTLTSCLDLAGLRYTDVGDGAVLMRLSGNRAAEVVVDAKESKDGVAFFSIDIPGYSGFGAKAVLRTLLTVSLRGDYVKAMSLPGGGFALAAEIPAGALTPSVSEGLTWSLVALGDVSGPSDVKDASGWDERLNNCRSMQNRYIRIDEDAARAEVDAIFQASGLASGIGSYVLDLGHERRSVTLHVSQRVISLMVGLDGVQPGNDKRKLELLLELNRRVDIAKVGLASNGDVTLLFELPAAVPDLLERATAQLSYLYAGVRAAI